MRPATVVFAVAVAAQWIVPLSGVWLQERTIGRGLALRIECTAPDPYDVFRGRYLAVQPAEMKLPAPAGMPDAKLVTMWATLVTGDDGLSRIESLSLEPVSGPTVIRLKGVKPRSGEQKQEALLAWPFDRFYLNERLAPDADRIVAERLRAQSRPVAEIRVLEGRAVLTDVLLDGVSIRELVKRQAE